MSYLPARATDPETSFQAAEHIVSSGKQATQQQRAVEAVRAHQGLTSFELSEASGLCRWMLARRLPEAERQRHVIRGAARKCRITGSSAATWWVEPQQMELVA